MDSRFHPIPCASLPRYRLAIPACNGVSRRWVLPIKVEVASGMQSSGTGPTRRQLQDKVGGVTPAGLFLPKRHHVGFGPGLVDEDLSLSETANDRRGCGRKITPTCSRVCARPVGKVEI